MIVDICTPYKGCRYPQSRRQEHAWSGSAFWGGSRRAAGRWSTGPGTSGSGPTGGSSGSARYFTWTESGDEHQMRDLTAVKAALKGHEIELPSWAFGNSGTRFKVFGQPGVPRDPYEKFADAAQVHKYTGVAPRVSLHIPWDRVDDYAKLTDYADDLGVRIGAINSNLFQDDEYRLGSLTHPDRSVRRKAIAHHAECVDVMRQTGSAELKLWLPDGT